MNFHFGLMAIEVVRSSSDFYKDRTILSSTDRSKTTPFHPGLCVFSDVSSAMVKKQHEVNQAS